jgi:hypothetical protein
MNLTDPVRIYPMVNRRVLTDPADAFRFPNSVMRQIDQLAEFGRRLAAEVATARAQRREAFRTALSVLKRRHQAMTDALSAAEVEQITAEVITALSDRAAQIAQSGRKRCRTLSEPATHRLDALAIAAHAPPVRPASKTSTQRVLML